MRSPYNARMDIDLHQLPIPDWGLLCPRCRYPLKGLPRHRCPECGLQIDIPALIQTWTRLRDPRFTGGERPLPDFGLTCSNCDQPLAGAPASVCPHCQTPFDLETLRPQKAWCLLDAGLCGPLPIPGVQALLATESVPHVPVNEKTLREIYGGQSMIVTRLRIPSEFYFEVLWLIRRARLEMDTARSVGDRGEWLCSQCGEPNPAHFEVCWNCEQPRNQP